MALAISALKYNYVSIQSPTSGKKAVDLSNHIIHTEYFEDLLSPVITMKMRIRSEFHPVFAGCSPSGLIPSPIDPITD